jgi:putative acetyltransferase
VFADTEKTANVHLDPEEMSRPTLPHPYQDVTIRNWQPSDRPVAAALVGEVLNEYGLQPDAETADWDLWHVETAYWQTGGQFWVVERQSQLVGTAGFYPINRRPQTVEIRKMYLHPSVRGQGLGRHLLHQLELAIATQGYQQIWIETASVLKEAVRLYESNGYQRTSGCETARCDLMYVKTLANQPPQSAPISR